MNESNTENNQINEIIVYITSNVINNSKKLTSHQLHSMINRLFLFFNHVTRTCFNMIYIYINIKNDLCMCVFTCMHIYIYIVFSEPFMHSFIRIHSGSGNHCPWALWGQPLRFSGPLKLTWGFLAHRSGSGNHCQVTFEAAWTLLLPMGHLTPPRTSQQRTALRFCNALVA